MAQWVKNLPAMQEIQVGFLGWEDPLEKEMANHSSILAWRIPMDRGACWSTVHGVSKSQTQLKQLSTAQHSAYIFNKLSDNIWPCHIPFLNWKQSVAS